MTSLGSLFSRKVPSNPITNIVSFFIWRASPVSVLCRAVTDCPLIAAHEAAQWYLYIYIVLCIQLIVTGANSASKSSIRRFVITEKAPARAFSWLKAATTAFTFKTQAVVEPMDRFAALIFVHSVTNAHHWHNVILEFLHVCTRGLLGFLLCSCYFVIHFYDVCDLIYE